MFVFVKCFGLDDVFKHNLWYLIFVSFVVSSGWTNPIWPLLQIPMSFRGLVWQFPHVTWGNTWVWKWRRSTGSLPNLLVDIQIFLGSRSWIPSARKLKRRMVSVQMMTKWNTCYGVYMCITNVFCNCISNILILAETQEEVGNVFGFHKTDRHSWLSHGVRAPFLHGGVLE